MIRDFWVQNYLSIRDKQEMNYVARGPESELVAIESDGTLLYKLGILYGANASGKSNMLSAINEVFRLLVFPKSNANEDISGYHPFALTRKEPTDMFVSFYADVLRYDYYVSFDGKHILKEELHYYPNGSKSLFYERSFVADNVQADIKFGTSLKLTSNTKDSIRENTLNNHSVLSVCQKNSFKEDIEPFTKLHSWVVNNYHDVDGDNSDNKGIVEILKDACADERKHKFFVQMLKRADLNIADFRPAVKDRIISEGAFKFIKGEDYPEILKDEFLKPTVESVEFVNHSENDSFDISLDFQSKGTLKYIRILNILYDLISGKNVYYLDELGEDLHYDLLFYYLNVFLFNSEQSQLLMTSQETALLSQDLINENRGAIWFVEKNRKTASSEYNRGDSFGLHKNLSLYNSYRVGRLGAKPELGSFFVDLK